MCLRLRRGHRPVDPTYPSQFLAPVLLKCLHRCPRVLSLSVLLSCVGNMCSLSVICHKFVSLLLGQTCCSATPRFTHNSQRFLDWSLSGREKLPPHGCIQRHRIGGCNLHSSLHCLSSLLFLPFPLRSTASILGPIGFSSLLKWLQAGLGLLSDGGSSPAVR